ncbi:MAG: hypothetical protein IT449_17735 [Phycisphaerales bacterium]|nr:hypothetical protein [Phycisphaerales bacterium]
MAASTVIKAGHMGSVLQRLSRVDLADHLREADAVVGAARRQAEELLRQARGEVAGLHEAARREGYALGFDEGRVQGLKDGHEEAFRQASEKFATQQAQAMHLVTQVIGEFEARKRDLLFEAEQDLVRFAVEVAGRLTFDLGAQRGEAAKANMERALAKISSATDLTIRANPCDAATLETFAAEHVKSWGEAVHVRMVPDESIAPGGCVVTAGATQIDADLTTLVRQMNAAILGEAEHA